MAVDCNQAGAPNYFPNSFSGPSVDPTVALHKFAPSGDVARYNSADEDNFTQVRREEGERRRREGEKRDAVAGQREGIF